LTKSINDLIIEYFKNHPKQDLPHGPVVDWVTKEYKKTHSTSPRDPWRAIRKLHQEGILIKVGKGVHRYDPDFIEKVELFEFSLEVKEKIFKRDNYRCVVCNKGKKDGVEICADHIRPKDLGGHPSVDNGQTLCMKHNLLKKNYSQTEAGKRYFIKMYKMAVKKGDLEIINFCKSVFDAFNSHQINTHVRRPNKHKYK